MRALHFPMRVHGGELWASRPLARSRAESLRPPRYLPARHDLHARNRLPCAVRDLWPAGARLLVPSSSKLPAQFRLLVEAAGIEVSCTLFMRSEDAVEVSLVYPPA